MVHHLGPYRAQKVVLVRLPPPFPSTRLSLLDQDHITWLPQFPRIFLSGTTRLTNLCFRGPPHLPFC